MNFEFEPLAIPEVVLVTPRAFADDRGYFIETYHQPSFRDAGIDATFVQDNASRSAAGVLRGLHYQLDPMAQGKLVRVVAGAVFDVAVDIRTGSPTYGQWVGAELDDGDHRMLWVPPGFLHGFVTLSDTVHLSYKCTAVYSPAHDRGVRWDDPAIGIEWPVAEPKLSPKDLAQPLLADAENTFVYEP